MSIRYDSLDTVVRDFMVHELERDQGAGALYVSPRLTDAGAQAWPGILTDGTPASFTDVNTLRTDVEHDVDHGDKGKIAKKKKAIGETFKRYAGAASPDVLDSARFVLVQANLLSALELDLRNLAIPTKPAP